MNLHLLVSTCLAVSVSGSRVEIEAASSPKVLEHSASEHNSSFVYRIAFVYSR